jgi:hypothetical protein
MYHFSHSATDVAALESDSMPMNHSKMATDASSTVHTHNHLMTVSMLRVEHEHMWFMVVGLAIGAFKFLSDGEFVRTRMVRYMWPSCMVLLGLMLLFYRE